MSDLPDTPVGKQLSRLIQILSEGKEITPGQVSEIFHPSFVGALGSPEIVVSVLKSWSDQFAPFKLEAKDELSEPHLIAVEITGPNGQGLVLTCTVDESEAHLITGLVSRPKPRDITSLDDVDDLLGYHDAAGLSVAVVIEGEITWTRAWGVTDTSSPAPLTPDTILQCGSISKPVAALAALGLVDEGILNLDTDVNEILTSWRVPPVNGWQPVISIRDLLTHIAGLTVWGFPGYKATERIPSLVEVLHGAGNTPAIRSEALARLMWRYSGGGYCVLQQVMTDVTRKAFSDLLRDLVLDPMGMGDSTFEQPIPPSMEKRAASGHGGGQPVEGRWHVYPEMAAAGLWTTPSDLARFVVGVAEGTVLSKSIASEMLTGHDVAPGMGLGLAIGGSSEVRTFGHGGANAGFTGQVVSTYDGSFGLTGLSNSNEGIFAINDLFRFLAQEQGLPDLLKVSSMGQDAQMGMMRAVPIEHRAPAEVSQSNIDSYVGEYDAGPAGLLGVEIAGGGLSVQVAGQNPLPIYPHSEDAWVSEAIDVRVEFEEGRLVLHQLGRTVEAKKLR